MSREKSAIVSEWKNVFDKYLSSAVKDQERGVDGEYELITPTIPFENVCTQVCLKEHYHHQCGEDDIREYETCGDISKGEWCGLAVIYEYSPSMASSLQDSGHKCHIYLMSQENLDKYSSAYGISNECTNHLKLWKLLEHDQLAVNHRLHNSLVNILGFWISNGLLANRSCLQVLHEVRSREMTAKVTNKLIKWIQNGRSFGSQYIEGKDLIQESK